jgi:hypothetical protein
LCARLHDTRQPPHQITRWALVQPERSDLLKRAVRRGCRTLAIQRELYLEFREPGFAPAPLLEHPITAGYLGRTTGHGFRDYS